MAENKADEEYTLQYYGFTTEEFFQDFSESVMEDMVIAMQQSMATIALPNCNVDNKLKIIDDCGLLHQVWSERVGDVLEKLRPIIDDFFAIPKNVLLPVDAAHAQQYTPEEIKKLEEEVNALEEEYAKEIRAKQQYKEEIAILDKLIPLQQKVDEATQKLEKCQIIVKEVEELEVTEVLHKEACKEFMNKNEYEELQESIDLAVHESKFKTA